MLDRVTGQNARHWNGGDITRLDEMDDGRATRFARWKSELVPRSHVLVKALGDMINASWDVTNTGGVEGVGFIDIVIPALGTVGWTGPGQRIPPGATRTLTLSGQVSTLTPGSYACQLRVRAASPSTVAPGGTHDFTITVPPGSAVMQGLGIPVST